MAGPGMVTPGLSQAVARDFTVHSRFLHRLVDNPPGLGPADRSGFAFPTIEEKLTMPVGKEPAQRIEDLAV